MDELPRQKLGELLTTYGRSLCDDPRRCEGLLRDMCGAHKREVNVLVSALKEHIATDLLSSSVSSQPRKVLFARLTKRLTENLGLAEDAARWAVESWALALGVIDSVQEETSQQDKPAKRRASAERKQAPVKKDEPTATLQQPIVNKNITDRDNTSPPPNIKVTDTRASSSWQDSPEQKSELSARIEGNTNSNTDTPPATTASKDYPTIVYILSIPLILVGVMVLLLVSAIIAMLPIMLVLFTLDMDWNELGDTAQGVLGLLVLALTVGVMGLLSTGWEILKSKFGYGNSQTS